MWLALLAFQSLGYLGRPGEQLAPDQMALGLLLTVVAIGAGEARHRLYRRVWLVAGLEDAVAVGLAVGEAALLIFAANAAMPSDVKPFRLLVPALAAPAAVVAIGMYRLIPRLAGSARRKGNRLLVVVSDSAMYPTVKTLVQHPTIEWSPVALVSMQSEEVNRTVMGLPIMGHTSDLQHWMEVMRADGVAFAVSAAKTSEMRELLGLCLNSDLPIFVVPAPDDWFRGERGVPFRQLTADDLVGREPRQIEVDYVGEMVAGRTVLVTGAAGSIGSELCRLLATLRPGRLVLVDNNESGLFEIAEELRVEGTLDVKESLLSVAEYEPLVALFADERPDIVFHAAAYKHVPMLESHPNQAVMTNVIGTHNALRCSEAVGVQAFVLISTDKAVARHSVMGCTKRICELMVLSYSGAMKCWAVRFGNVVGSRGSVVPIFERQIAHGGPVTITHPEVSRYMMTIAEAVSLVLSTLRLSKPGHLYMLDMGEPIKILALAHALIRSRGLRPGSDIEIVFTGLRPGERLTEDILATDEGWRPTPHPSIFEVVSPCHFTQSDLDWTIQRLVALAGERRSEELVRVLKTAVLTGRRPDAVGLQSDVRVPRSPVGVGDG